MDIILGNIRAIRVTHTFSGHLHGEREESRERIRHDMKQVTLCFVLFGSIRGGGGRGVRKRSDF